VATADLKFDDRAFRKALLKFAQNSKKSNEQILKDQARLFVKDVTLITPPNKDFKANRKGGETAIKADIAKIMRQSSAMDARTDPADVHAKYRDANTGRVKRKLKNRIKIAGLGAFIKKELEKVGILASGWNAAAEKLGAKVPDWVARHGKDRGSIKLAFSLAQCRITITNAVKFAGNVKGLVRRVQRALDKRAGAMNRQIEHFQKRSARGAGFK